MLKKEREISCTGKSVIDGVEVVGFSAKINLADPSNVTFSSWQINKDLYKENRSQCRTDEAEFEDFVYEEQDKLIAEVQEVVE